MPAARTAKLRRIVDITPNVYSRCTLPSSSRFGYFAAKVGCCASRDGWQGDVGGQRSEEHTLNSIHLVISYAVFCLKKKKKIKCVKHTCHFTLATVVSYRV